VERNDLLIAISLLLLGPFVSDIVAGTYHGFIETLLTVIGVLILVAGIFWGNVSKAIPPAAVRSIDRFSTDVRVWFGLALILWTYLVAVQFIDRSHLRVLSLMQSDLATIRGDFDQYVKPRHLTQAQAKAISDYLLPRPAQTVDVFFIYPDSEAAQYAAEISSALHMGGWTANLQAQSNPIVNGMAMEDGLRLFVRYTQQHMMTNQGTPKAIELLGEAFAQAKISSSGMGSMSDGSIQLTTVAICVGHRPRT